MHLAFSSMNTPSDPHPAELARALEERGFESLWYGEHSHIPCSRATPYPPGGEMPAPYRNMMGCYYFTTGYIHCTNDLCYNEPYVCLNCRNPFENLDNCQFINKN